MRKFVSLILLITLMLQLTGDAGFNATNMNPQSQVHIAHIGIGTANLNCDTCHGFPTKYPITVNEGAGPGSFIVCEQCHAPPPDSMKPSMGNLIVIHLSRGLYCTNCHDTDTITPVHPSTKAENGTVQVIKCENCHANPQNSISHVNGGKYCLDCHGYKTGTLAITPIQTVPVTTYIPPTATATQTPPFINPQSQVHNIHIGPGTANLKCDTCHGFPPVYNPSKGVCTTCHPAVKVTATIPTVATYPASTVPVSTYIPPAATQIKKRAQLQVTYEIGAGKTKAEPTVSVQLKNIGNAMATKVNLIIENPPDLQVTVLSGSEQTGNTITWKGEIEPGKEHITQYAVKIVTGKDIEVPVKITYVKISQEEKARELGINSASAAEVNAALTPEEIELITLVMKITLSAIPGFEGIMAIVLVLSAGIILRKIGR